MDSKREFAVDLDTFTIDELWALHEQISTVLTSKIRFEQNRLDTQLSQLNGSVAGSDRSKASIRRPYPKVQPKYRSLKNPALHWSGRGRKPRWLVAEMAGSKKLTDFLIDGQKSEGSQKK